MMKRLFLNIIRFIKRIFRTLAIIGLLFVLFSIFFVVYSDLRIKAVSSEQIFTESDSIKHNKVGVVLGTSKKLADGRDNLYFKYRIDAAAELYEAGKIDYILVSGDNGSRYYNEPLDMQKALIDKGIPRERIYLDYAGFRTYDSMVRAWKIFGQKSFTVISQRFHIERAVYIAKRLGINAQGYVARDVGKYGGFKTKLREKLARAKVFFDFMFGVKPKYLGEAIEIPDISE